MKKIALWAMCIAVMVLSGCRKAPEWKAEHVFVIGLDGWGAYSVAKADMPNVKALMDAGCYTLKKRSVLPSSSAVNWASMFMGAGPELHGYTEWGSRYKPQNKMFHFCKTFCSKITLVNTIQNVILNPI